MALYSMSFGFRQPYQVLGEFTLFDNTCHSVGSCSRLRDVQNGASGWHEPIELVGHCLAGVSEAECVLPLLGAFYMAKQAFPS